MVKKTGIFGGSFDPPHNGHQHLVENCFKQFHFDEIYIIPSYQNPQKAAYQTKPQHRMEMLSVLFKNFNKTKILDDEIRRKEVSYTIDTLKTFDLNDNTHLIIGEDLLFQIHRWKSFEKIIERVHLVVVFQSNGDWLSKKREWPILFKKKLKKMNENSIELNTRKEVYFLHTQKFQHLSSNLIRHKIRSSFPIDDDVPSELIPLIQKYYHYLKPISQEDWMNDLSLFLKDKGAIHPEWFHFEEVMYESILISSGLNARHVQALSLALQEYIKIEYGLVPRHTEGEDLSQWVVLDYNFLIVHIFYNYLREYYQLEDFWKKRSVRKQ